MPRLWVVYPGICLTTEEKALKTLSQVITIEQKIHNITIRIHSITIITYRNQQKHTKHTTIYTKEHHCKVRVPTILRCAWASFTRFCHQIFWPHIVFHMFFVCLVRRNLDLTTLTTLQVVYDVINCCCHTWDSLHVATQWQLYEVWAAVVVAVL